MAPPPPPSPDQPSFLRRFWRGDLSLAVSYWGVGLAVIVAVAAVLLAISFVIRHQAFNPYEVLAALTMIWSTILLGLTVQSVGVWRSARRHIRYWQGRGRLGIWGVAAQAVVVLGLLGAAGQLVFLGGPQFIESWQMAFQDDPSISPYAVRLMRDGTEAEIAGGFKYGLSRDAARLFAQAPNLKVVHLNSGGGRLGEAMELAKLIRARGLTTYTSASCSSACTIAFTAGRDRYLRSGAKLGFHRAIFAGTESTDEMRQLLRGGNVEPRFIERAVAQPANSIWYPSEKELAAANVIMAVVDDDRYAASGLGLAPTLEDFKIALRLSPTFAALEAADAETFADAADVYQKLYHEGVPDGRIADEIRTRLVAPLLLERRQSAPDDLMVAYAHLMADQYDALGAKSAEACFAFATRASTADAVALLPPDLRQRDAALQERTLRARTRRKPTTPEELNEAALALSKALIARYGIDNVRLLASPANVTPAQHAAFCKLSAGMFRAIADDLQPPQAGAEMSAIFSGMAKGKK